MRVIGRIAGGSVRLCQQEVIEPAIHKDYRLRKVVDRPLIDEVLQAKDRVGVRPEEVMRWRTLDANM